MQGIDSGIDAATFAGPLGVEVLVNIIVLVGLAVFVGLGVFVGLAVCVLEGVKVAVGFSVSVTVDVNVFVGEGLIVEVCVGVSVLVGIGATSGAGGEQAVNIKNKGIIKEKSFSNFLNSRIVKTIFLYISTSKSFCRLGQDLFQNYTSVVSCDGRNIPQEIQEPLESSRIIPQRILAKVVRFGSQQTTRNRLRKRNLGNRFSLHPFYLR